MPAPNFRKEIYKWHFCVNIIACKTMKDLVIIPLQSFCKPFFLKTMIYNLWNHAILLFVENTIFVVHHFALIWRAFFRTKFCQTVKANIWLSFTFYNFNFYFLFTAQISLFVVVLLHYAKFILNTFISFVPILQPKISNKRR